jgi:hypothetical protein
MPEAAPTSGHGAEFIMEWPLSTPCPRSGFTGDEGRGLVVFSARRGRLLLQSFDVNPSFFNFQFFDQDVQALDTPLVGDARKQAAVMINFLVDLCAPPTHRLLLPSGDQPGALG